MDINQDAFRRSESLHPKCASTVHDFLHSFPKAGASHSSCRRGTRGRGRSITTWHGISNQTTQARPSKSFEAIREVQRIRDMLAGYNTHYSMFLVHCCSKSVALPRPGLANKKLPDIWKNPWSTAGLSSMFKNNDLNSISHPVQQ